MSASKKIGILAYGSLLTYPGEEVEPLIIERISVETPFEVEYARRSSSRNGAPTLVPVPDGKGSRVRAKIFVLKGSVSVETAKNILYRREIHRIGAKSLFYNDERQRGLSSGVIIEELKNFSGFSTAIYTYLKHNINEIIADDITDTDKSKIIARLAINSLNSETFRSGKDGIQYLHDCIQKGIITKLTGVYQKAILTETGAKDLLNARIQ